MIMFHKFVFDECSSLLGWSLLLFLALLLLLCMSYSRNILSAISAYRTALEIQTRKHAQLNGSRAEEILFCKCNGQTE